MLLSKLLVQEVLFHLYPMKLDIHILHGILGHLFVLVSDLIVEHLVDGVHFEKRKRIKYGQMIVADHVKDYM